MSNPYIYIVKNKQNGKFYIGSQCSGKIIGVNYFTSSTDKEFKEDFKNNPQNSLMYVDETAVKHKTYSYMIVAERSNGSIEQSRTVFINIP